MKTFLCIYERSNFHRHFAHKIIVRLLYYTFLRVLWLLSMKMIYPKIHENCKFSFFVNKVYFWINTANTQQPWHLQKPVIRWSNGNFIDKMPMPMEI